MARFRRASNLLTALRSKERQSVPVFGPPPSPIPRPRMNVTQFSHYQIAGHVVPLGLASRPSLRTCEEEVSLLSQALHSVLTDSAAKAVKNTRVYEISVRLKVLQTQVEELREAEDVHKARSRRVMEEMESLEREARVRQREHEEIKRMSRFNCAMIDQLSSAYDDLKLRSFETPFLLGMRRVAIDVAKHILHQKIQKDPCIAVDKSGKVLYPDFEKTSTEIKFPVSSSHAVDIENTITRSNSSRQLRRAPSSHLSFSTFAAAIADRVEDTVTFDEMQESSTLSHDMIPPRRLREDHFSMAPSKATVGDALGIVSDEEARILLKSIQLLLSQANASEEIIKGLSLGPFIEFFESILELSRENLMVLSDEKLAETLDALSSVHKRQIERQEASPAAKHARNVFNAFQEIQKSLIKDERTLAQDNKTPLKKT